MIQRPLGSGFYGGAPSSGADFVMDVPGGDIQIDGGGGKKSCPTCTFDNDPMLSYCEICGSQL